MKFALDVPELGNDNFYWDNWWKFFFDAWMEKRRVKFITYFDWSIL